MSDQRTGPAVVSMLAPAVVAVVGLIAFVAVAGGLQAVVRLFQYGGFFSFAILGCGVVGVAAVSVLGFLFGSGRSVPLAAPAVVALLPWLAGLAGTMGGMMMVESALAAVDPSQAALLYTVGTGEVLATRAMGSWSSAALLVGVALFALIGAGPERRAASWTSAAVLAAAGLFAGAAAFALLALIGALTGAGMVEPAMRATLVAAGVAEAALGRTVQLGAALLLGVAILVAVAAGALQRRVVGAVVLGILLVGVAALDFGFDRFATRGAERLARPVWADTPDFEPLPISRSDRAALHGVVTPSEVRLTGEAPIPPADPRLADALGRIAPADTGAELGFLGGPKRSRAVGLAFDRRTAGPVLREVFEAGARAGVHAIHLAGRAGGDLPLPEVMTQDAPYLALLTAQIGTVELLTTAGLGSEDPHLLYAELAGPLVEVKKPDGTPMPEPAPEGATVRLILLDSVTAADLAAAAEQLHARGLLPAVVRERPAPPAPPEEPSGRGILGLLGAFGDEPTGGKLAPEAIRRVMKARAKEIRRCYQRRLAKRPSLEGKLKVSFRIEPTGKVKRAQVTESTLGDVEVEQCVVGVLKKTTFPKPQGGAIQVSYPFVFARR